MKMDALGKKFLPFAAIISPDENSRSVAAQGLLHILTLASVGAIRVDQISTSAPVVVSMPV